MTARCLPCNYNYFRDYDPSTGRYVQSDPIGLRGGLNTFSYTGSNPVDTSDAGGLATGRRGGWVECEGGKLVPRYANDFPAYYWRCGLIDCVLVHERTHIFDMNSTGQDGQCRFLAPGVEARMIGSAQSEVNAYFAHLVCLVIRQKNYTKCDDCWLYIEDQIKHVTSMKKDYEAAL